MLRRSALFLLMSFFVAGCGDTAGPENRIVGTWRLQTVEGQPLPFTLEESATLRLELTGEAITLAASGGMAMVTTFRVTDHGNVFTESIPDAGTYSVSGATVSFTFDSDGSTPIGIVNGDTMTLDDIGLTFVYRRD